MAKKVQTFPFCWVEGDRLPEIVVTLRRPAPEGSTSKLKGQDLTGYTITLHLKRPAPSAVLIKNAIAIDLTEGKFKFSWAVDDLVVGVGQEAEIQFINPSAEPLTSQKFLMDVREQIA